MHNPGTASALQKVLATSRKLLVVFIVLLLAGSHWKFIAAMLVNNLGSTFLNRALLAPVSREQRDESFRRAGEKFQFILGMEAVSGYAAYNLGTLYLQFGDAAAAHSAFTRAVNALPEDSVSLFQLGMTTATLEDEASAIALWQQAGAAPYFVNSCRALKQTDPAGALRDAQRAVAIDPQLLEGVIALGEVYTAQKDDSRALQAYQTAVTLAPEDRVSLNRLGEVLRRLGRTAEAQAIFQSALRVDPAYAPTLLNIASIHAEQARCEQTGVLLEPLLSSRARSADRARALRLTGTCYLQRENAGYALPYLHELSQLDAVTASDMLLLGQAYEMTGYRTEAAKLYAEVLGMNPDNQTARQALDRLSGEEP